MKGRKGGGGWGSSPSGEEDSSLLTKYRARFFKFLRRPRIGSKEPIMPGCVAWSAVRQSYSYSVPSPQRLFKNSITGFQCSAFFALVIPRNRNIFDERETGTFCVNPVWQYIFNFLVFSTNKIYCIFFPGPVPQDFIFESSPSLLLTTFSLLLFSDYWHCHNGSVSPA